MVADIFQLPQVVGSNDGRELPLFHVVCENALYGLPHNRIQAVKSLVTKQVLRSGADAAQDGNLLFHTLGKGIDLPVLLKSEAL